MENFLFHGPCKGSTCFSPAVYDASPAFVAFLQIYIYTLCSPDWAKKQNTWSSPQSNHKYISDCGIWSQTWFVAAVSVLFLNNLGIFDNVYRDIMIDKTRDISRSIYDSYSILIYPFYPSCCFFGILDDGYAAVKLIKFQIFVDIHAFSCFDVILVRSPLKFSNVLVYFQPCLSPPLIYMNIQKCQDQCHTDIDTILYLLEINSSWIIINFNRNFVDTRKWMENQHIFWCKFHFPFVQV